jgi:hypothetical protein
MTSTWVSSTASAGLSAARAPQANPMALDAASNLRKRSKNPELAAFTPDRRYFFVSAAKAVVPAR